MRESVGEAMSERHHREDERRWIAAMQARHARGLEYVCGLADVLRTLEERDEAWAEVDRLRAEVERLRAEVEMLLRSAEERGAGDRESGGARWKPRESTDSTR